MKDTYKGETYIKSANRVMFWTAIQRRIGKDRFKRGRFLVLASREAGDISCLLGLDVPIENIVAVDINPTAVQQAKQKYPDATVLIGDVTEIVRDKQYEGSFDFVYLDVCGCVGERLIDLCSEVIRWGTKDRSYVGWTTQAGRESELSQLRKMKEISIALSDLTLGSTPPAISGSGNDPIAPKYIKRYNNAKTRIVWLGSGVWKEIGILRYMMTPTLVGGYHSGRTPMVTSQYLIERTSVTMSKRESACAKKDRKDKIETAFLWDVDENQFRDWVVLNATENDVADISKVFNLPISKVSAWKAWWGRKRVRET